MDRRIISITNLLVNRLDHPWRVEEVASKLGLSLSHFQKLFKDQVGLSPIAFLRGHRLESARQMLEERPNLRIKEIGYITGLTNSSHFTRDFKERFGLAPKEYRRQNDARIGTEIEQDLPSFEMLRGFANK